MLLFFDTETTNKADFKAPFTAPQQPHLVQLGALLTDDDGTERAAIDVIIKPDGWAIPPEVAAIHGITTELANRVGVPIQYALALFSRFCLNATTLIAHNINFDLLIMRAAYHRLDKVFEYPNLTPFCTMNATTPICKLPGFRGQFKWPKLIEAHQHFFGVGFDSAHSAMADVQACKRIYLELTKSK